MTDHDGFLDQINELIRANAWEGQLIVELVPSSVPSAVRVSLSAAHPTAPSEVINQYVEGLNPLEQVQQECLRALRTGRPGI